ncbi:MAG: bifunctional 4-hydroxy-2-oxoglutarate aldolase/2-dehydro-3-deoxy-phosphogluconate aldolase [Candidatus Limnocylindrales bacterium]|jgi:2-dehydro-3-deoxyphosphogluconate aldolase/(4S)-4-hydroxy-2-oxoglutarate aldolase|nr:bifunctional 4-hydroxy-2-oxoglutarate aldolase/2-dehydro-3-deoxy-phosphogluconate aldolase [Candidatus Limnocylindrales bacterium]
MSAGAAEMDLAAALRDAGVVPVVTLTRPEQAVPVAEALLAGGLACVEITFRSDAAPAAIEAIRARVPSLLVGAGTILTVAQADTAMAAGASFLVAPGFNPAVVDHVLDRGIPMLPGVCTPSEIEQALARGLELVKFFPAAAMGGVAFLRALAGPYPMLRYVPTGGITPENAVEYLALRSVVAVGGTWLTTQDVVAAGEWATITGLAADAAAMVRRARDGAAPRPRDVRQPG